MQNYFLQYWKKKKKEIGIQTKIIKKLFNDFVFFVESGKNDRKSKYGLIKSVCKINIEFTIAKNQIFL